MTVYDNYRWLPSPRVVEPVVLIEESKRFTKPAVLRVFSNMDEAEEGLKTMVIDPLVKKMRTITISYNREIIWHRLRRDPDGGSVTSFVFAKFRLELLSEVIRDGMSVRTWRGLDDFLNQ